MSYDITLSKTKAIKVHSMPLAVSRIIVKTAKNYLRNCIPRGRGELAGVAIAELQLTKKNPIR